MITQEELPYVSSAVTALATTLGAFPALVVHKVSQKTQDALMGFSAGVMLAASAFSLIIPALHSANEQVHHKLTAATFVALSILVGALLLHLCNLFIPHEHFFTGREGGPSQMVLKRIWLFVLAITLHNFPEGLAVGSGAGSHNPTVAIPILIGIALQDIPEGFVVAMALISAKYKPSEALGVAVVTGIVEALAALVGYYSTSTVQALLPWSLAFAGGAMLFVVSNEMIPESHKKENATFATAGLMVGFVLMMVLDTALGQ